MTEHKVYVACKLGAGSKESLRLVKRAVITALRAENVDVPCEISVKVTDNEGIRKLNREYRDVDAPTDVLSFPLSEQTPGEFSTGEDGPDPETGRFPLGDIVISAERARAQAREFGHPVSREMAYLTVHSVLHLLGYDHTDEGPEKIKMRAREEHILGIMGLSR